MSVNQLKKVLLMAGILYLAACTWAPENGSNFSGNSQVISINVGGGYTKPSIPIRVEGYDMGANNWVVLGNTVTSVDPILDDPVKGTLYGWDVNVVPGALWDQDGLVQIRAVATDGANTIYPVTFDDFDCVLERLNAGDTYTQAGAACASYNMPILTLGDLGALPSTDYSDNRFLEARTTPGGADYDCDNGGCEQLEYNNQINAPGTFNGWLLQSAFSEFSSHAASAQYYNAYDLGFGRNMNCQRGAFSQRVSCYVKNHGQVVVDDHVTAIADAISGANLVATVAMDYDPADVANTVKFYAYNSAGNIVTDVALDNQGAKAMPGVCLNCHGGYYNANTNSISDAYFLPFDLDNYQYSTIVANKSRSAQEESFRQLNQIVTLTNAPTSMTDIIDGWYDNNLSTPNQLFNSEYVPASWTDYETVYNEVVKPYCRTCHIAMDGYRDWDSFSELANYFNSPSFVVNLVCNNGITRMPHAELTLNKFWRSRGRAHLVGFMQKAGSYTPTNSCTP